MPIQRFVQMIPNWLRQRMRWISTLRQRLPILWVRPCLVRPLASGWAWVGMEKQSLVIVRLQTMSSLWQRSMIPIIRQRLSRWQVAEQWPSLAEVMVGRLIKVQRRHRLKRLSLRENKFQGILSTRERQLLTEAMTMAIPMSKSISLHRRCIFTKMEDWWFLQILYLEIFPREWRHRGELTALLISKKMRS